MHGREQIEKAELAKAADEAYRMAEITFGSIVVLKLNFNHHDVYKYVSLHGRVPPRSWHCRTIGCVDGGVKACSPPVESCQTFELSHRGPSLHVRSLADAARR